MNRLPTCEEVKAHAGLWLVTLCTGRQIRVRLRVGTVRSRRGTERVPVIVEPGVPEFDGCPIDAFYDGEEVTPCE